MTPISVVERDGLDARGMRHERAQLADPGAQLADLGALDDQVVRRLIERGRAIVFLPGPLVHQGISRSPVG
ncbi:MAG: hypothetical protein M0Z82_03720 [Actinomycetota bacterium]|nr:hypothetical protein [Actinomycetota bacterium]